MSKICDMDCFHCKYDDCINDYVRPGRTEAQKWYDRERMREKRELYRKYGICTKCFHEEARKGFATCEKCAEKIRLRSKRTNSKRIFDKRETWKMEGLCYFCGAKRAKGYKVCPKCLERCKKNTPATRPKGGRNESV